MEDNLIIYDASLRAGHDRPTHELLMWSARMQNLARPYLN